MITLYGIRSCDSCRKALKWLGEQDVEHAFHDLRDDGLDAALVQRWLESPYADRLVNRRSTTWRGLSEAERSASGEALLALILSHPTLVKRPVVMDGDEVLGVGFAPDSLGARIAQARHVISSGELP